MRAVAAILLCFFSLLAAGQSNIVFAPKTVANTTTVPSPNTVTTSDIDNFWRAFDALAECKTRIDSIMAIQTLYLNNATDGLYDFMSVRDFTAERFVNTIARVPKFYASVRANTYRAKEAAAAIQVVFQRFKEIYPNFKPFKVCFAIGLVNTGGTVSDKYVLIGTEVTMSTRKCDLSEFGNLSYTKMLAGDENFTQKIMNMVAHESVHTQQNRVSVDTNAVDCPLLYRCIHEGACDFIGEITSGGQINAVIQYYGNLHEKELWTQFKNELCNEKAGNWLYNYGTVKDKPGDLGYYIGYRIARAYYNNATDKKQAITDIIEMKNPLLFLEKSGYDKDMRNK